MTKKRFKNKVLISFVAFIASSCVNAATPPPSVVPATVNPAIVGKQVESKVVTTPQALQPLAQKQEKQENPLGAEAAKIKFKLTKITIEGNHVYSDAKLEELYKEKLNKLITVAELQDIVQSITNYYRNNGYILSRAIIPPQHVKGGAVTIRVLEGYIDQVTVVGKPRGAKELVQAYGERISKQRPLQVKNMERYLFLANEIPGVTAKAILEPSKTQTAASDLNLSTDTKTLSGYFSYDNYGTRYIGPQQFTGNIQANSIFRSGDTTRFTYVTTARGNELKYRDINHDTPLGSSGLRFVGDYNQAMTVPLFTLQPLQIEGNAINWSGTLRYPAIRSRSQNLTLEGAFNYLNSRTTQLNGLFLLYNDRVRSLRAGATYDFADRFRGSNLINANIIKGLPVLGATTDDQSFTTSRFGATSEYTRITLQMTRLQQLFWKLSLFGLVKGQYVFQPLLASEQFGYGGSQLGRGYDPAEIIGDRGAAGSVELRLDVVPQYFLIQAAEFYVFYDAGVVWNLRNVQGTPTKMDATSTGVGVRFYINRVVSGNFMFTQPLSKKVAALEQIGNGSLPRTFFSLVFSA